MKGKLWADAEREAIWGLYQSLAFGQFHGGHPEVRAAAQSLGRTPASVATKLCNLYWLDSSGAKGLPHVSRADAGFIDRKHRAGQRHPSLATSG